MNSSNVGKNETNTEIYILFVYLKYIYALMVITFPCELDNGIIFIYTTWLRTMYLRYLTTIGFIIDPSKSFTLSFMRDRKIN